MEVYGYDPYISIEAAWNPEQSGAPLRKPERYAAPVRLHHHPCALPCPPPRTPSTPRPSPCARTASRSLNYARGELVNTAALLEAMDNGKVSGYMTDFPPKPFWSSRHRVHPAPWRFHPGSRGQLRHHGSTGAERLPAQRQHYHSVNLPEVHQPRAGGKRICIIHKNEPGMISQIIALTTEAGLNIENMVNKSKRTWPTPCWTPPVPWMPA